MAEIPFGPLAHLEPGRERGAWEIRDDVNAQGFVCVEISFFWELGICVTHQHLKHQQEEFIVSV